MLGERHHFGSHIRPMRAAWKRAAPPCGGSAGYRTVHFAAVEFARRIPTARDEQVLVDRDMVVLLKRMGS